MSLSEKLKCRINFPTIQSAEDTIQYNTELVTTAIIQLRVVSAPPVSRVDTLSADPSTIPGAPPVSRVDTLLSSNLHKVSAPSCPAAAPRHCAKLTLDSRVRQF